MAAKNPLIEAARRQIATVVGKDSLPVVAQAVRRQIAAAVGKGSLPVVAQAV